MIADTATPAEIVTTDDAPSSHFEVHVLRGDRWMIDSTAREEDLALADARRFFRRAGVTGVKVIKETYVPRLDRSTARVVFQQMRAPAPAAQARHVESAQLRARALPASYCDEADDEDDTLSLERRLPPVRQPHDTLPMLLAFGTLAIVAGAVSIFLLLGLSGG